MAPLEMRLRAAVARRLNTGFSEVSIVCWLGPVPVFDVPQQYRDMAASMGLTVARPERVQS